MKVFPIRSTTEDATLEVLRAPFLDMCCHWNKSVIMAHNEFVAREFKTFLKINCMKHTLCPHIIPLRMGWLRDVKNFKGMNRACPDKGSLQRRVANVLFRYRNAPHSKTDKIPAQLFLESESRTHLSLAMPSLQRHVERKQVASKLYRDRFHTKRRICDLYQPVRIENTGGKEKWIPGTIVAVKGPEANDRRFVLANYLISDDVRGLGSNNNNNNLHVTRPAWRTDAHFRAPSLARISLFVKQFFARSDTCFLIKVDS